MVSNNPNIIKTIQEMLRKGEKEEKIVETLKSLGVNQQQIKNLILVSEANTFDLILSETKKDTINYLQEKEEDYTKKILENVLSKNQELVAKITDDFISTTKINQDKFEQDIIKKTETISDIVGDLKQRADVTKKDIDTLDYKIEHFTGGSGGSKISLLRKIGFGLGIILILLAIAKYIMLGNVASIDYLLLHIASLTAGIVLLVTSLW